MARTAASEKTKPHIYLSNSKCVDNRVLYLLIAFAAATLSLSLDNYFVSLSVSTFAPPLLSSQCRLVPFQIYIIIVVGTIMRFIY